MAKLGYTWYPKDWGNSENVFELTLIERGLYRELIDMAMLNDNKTEINIKVWARKFGSTEDEIERILITLEELDLIVCTDINLFIPSCESRLNLMRGGSNGGKKSKPTSKPTPKPFESLFENNEKPTPKQRERETKIESKVKEKEIPSESDFLTYCKSELNLNYKPLEYSLKAKFESWISNGWKDGNGNKIINWKSKVKNTIPFLKPMQQQLIDKPFKPTRTFDS